MEYATRRLHFPYTHEPLGEKSYLRKRFLDVIRNVRNGERFRSSLLRSPQMDPGKLLRARNDGKVEWNTKQEESHCGGTSVEFYTNVTLSTLMSQR